MQLDQASLATAKDWVNHKVMFHGMCGAATSAAECTVRRASLWRRQLGCPDSKPACGEAVCMGPLRLHTPAMLTFLCSTLWKCLVQSLRGTFREFPNFMQRLCLELASTRDQVRCSSNSTQYKQFNYHRACLPSLLLAKFMCFLLLFLSKKDSKMLSLFFRTTPATIVCLFSVHQASPIASALPTFEEMHRFQEDFRSGKNDYQVYFLPSTKCDFFVRKYSWVVAERVIQ